VVSNQKGSWKNACQSHGNQFRKSVQTLTATVCMNFVLLVLEAQVNQWISRSGWKDQGDGYVSIANQEDNIKTKISQRKLHLMVMLGILGYIVWFAGFVRMMLQHYFFKVPQ